jgi:hypothetical protein
VDSLLRRWWRPDPSRHRGHRHCPAAGGGGRPARRRPSKWSASVSRRRWRFQRSRARPPRRRPPRRPPHYRRPSLRRCDCPAPLPNAPSRMLALILRTFSPGEREEPGAILDGALGAGGHVRLRLPRRGRLRRRRARTLLCQCNNLVDPGVGVQRAQAVVPGRRHVDAARVHLAARRSVRRSNFPDARSTCNHERQDLSRG